MSIEVQIHDFNTSQFDQLAALFGSYFQPGDKLLTKSYTDWLYGSNPFGPARLVAAVEADRWIGFMALIPVHLVRRNARLVAYYVVNVLVHPEYHGKHIFGRMITVAKKFVTAEDAVLMGHPNDMALKSWQRARMHFHDPLKPHLVVPSLRAKGVRAHDVGDLKQLQAVLPALSEQALEAERWQLAVSEDYVNWRYLGHPINTYRTQLVEVKATPVGFLVSRKVRPGINLLVDQFMLERYAADALGCLPWFTISFRPKSSMREFSRSLWPLPVRKQIPFFCTHYQQPFTVGDVMNLGLSASDF
jgi:hypothetical protein